MADNVISRNIAKRRITCEYDDCDGEAFIHKYRTTRFSDIGNGPGGDKSFLDVRYGVYYCQKCKRFFTQKLQDGPYNGGRSNFTKQVHDRAVAQVIDKEKTLADAVRYMRHQYGTSIPITTLGDWVRREKTRREEQHGKQ